VIDDVTLRLIAGALAGAAVGLERQWSAQATGRAERFGGLRTFTCIGLIGAVSGWLWTLDAAVPASLLIGATAALVVAGYVAASRIDVDATTEVAALVVLAASVLAGLDRIALAGGLAAATTLLLAEKSRLHAFVARIDGEGFRAGVRFAVLALVVLPLVPEGPFGTWGGGIRPRALWILVLVFAGLSFAGYIARLAVSARYGSAITGLIGGLVSSTGVTLTFSRASRDRPEDGVPLAQGVLAACTVLVPRVLAAVAILAPALALPLAVTLAPSFVVGAIAVALGLRRSSRGEAVKTADTNPLQLGAALQMAAIFQVVLLGLHEVQSRFGGAGLRWSAVLLGLTDVDALTASMAAQSREGLAVEAAAAAIAIGVVSNTLLKATIAVTVGRGAFRWYVAAGLAAIAAALVVTLRATNGL
jgi:uncharacterized membrane protein (DUF4010 family)